MNTFAAAMLIVWTAGWASAMVRAGLKARTEALTRPSGKRVPGASAITPG